MTPIILIYLILNAQHRWEFLTIERAESATYCGFLVNEVNHMFTDTPGNIRIICVKDTGIDI